MAGKKLALADAGDRWRDRARYLSPDYVGWLEARVLELQRERDLLLFESDSEHARELAARDHEAAALRARVAALETELRERECDDD